jgi:hypothetical protein
MSNTERRERKKSNEKQRSNQGSSTSDIIEKSTELSGDWLSQAADERLSRGSEADNKNEEQSK